MLCLKSCAQNMPDSFVTQNLCSILVTKTARSIPRTAVISSDPKEFIMEKSFALTVVSRDFRYRPSPVLPVKPMVTADST